MRRTCHPPFFDRQHVGHAGRDFVGVADGDEERKPPRNKRLADLLHLFAAFWIKPRAGVVENEETRMRKKRPRKQHAPRLAVRKREEVAVQQFGEVQEARHTAQRERIGAAFLRQGASHLEGIDVEDAVEGQHLRHRVARSRLVDERMVAGL